jgi:DNA-binding response OmpR family regulator
MHMTDCRPILLIEDDLDYERLVREVLGNSESFEVRSAPSLSLGLDLIDRFPPEVILVDLNLSDSSGYATFLRVRERAPGIPIIVLTSLDDDQVALRAVEDGAQDYLVKSLVQPKLLARSMSMALSRQKREASPEGTAPANSGVVLSFLGCKGGVGASTTAVNIAALLAQSGVETIVIELQQAHAGTLARYLPAEPAHGLHALLEKPANSITAADLHGCVMKSGFGPHLLCQSPSSLWGAPAAAHVSSIVSLARRAYRFVILDLPAQVDDGVAQALKLSDPIVVIVDREWSSVNCGAALLHHLRSATALNSKVRVAVVERTRLEAPPPMVDIERRLKVRPLAVIPSAAEAIALSQSAHTPLVLLDPDNPFSLAHSDLADQLLPPVAAGPSGAQGAAPAPFSRRPVSRVIPETMYG